MVQDVPAELPSLQRAAQEGVLLPQLIPSPFRSPSEKEETTFEETQGVTWL